MRGDVEVPGDTVDLEVALDVAPLLLLDLFLNTVHKIHSVHHVVKC